MTSASVTPSAIATSSILRRWSSVRYTWVRVAAIPHKYAAHSWLGSCRAVSPNRDRRLRGDSGKRWLLRWPAWGTSRSGDGSSSPPATPSPPRWRGRPSGPGRSRRPCRRSTRCSWSPRPRPTSTRHGSRSARSATWSWPSSSGGATSSSSRAGWSTAVTSCCRATRSWWPTSTTPCTWSSWNRPATKGGGVGSSPSRRPPRSSTSSSCGPTSCSAPARSSGTSGSASWLPWAGSTLAPTTRTRRCGRCSTSSRSASPRSRRYGPARPSRASSPGSAPTTRSSCGAAASTTGSTRSPCCGPSTSSVTALIPRPGCSSWA